MYLALCTVCQTELLYRWERWLDMTSPYHYHVIPVTNYNIAASTSSHVTRVTGIHLCLCVKGVCCLFALYSPGVLWDTYSYNFIQNMYSSSVLWPNRLSVPCRVPYISGASIVNKVITSRTTIQLNENDYVDHDHGIQVLCSTTHQLRANARACCTFGNFGQIPTCDPRKYLRGYGSCTKEL